MRSLSAQADLRGVLVWTNQRFGRQQANAYSAALIATLKALQDGPETLGARQRQELGDNLFTIHVARPGRQVFVFRADGQRTPDVVEVVRVLHDSMDPARHLP